MPSEKILEQKKQLVAELTAALKESCTGVIVNYKGISVADDTKLRKQLREAGRRITSSARRSSPSMRRRARPSS